MTDYKAFCFAQVLFFVLASLAINAPIAKTNFVISLLFAGLAGLCLYGGLTP